MQGTGSTAPRLLVGRNFRGGASNGRAGPYPQSKGCRVLRVVMMKEERQLADWLRREYGAERFRIVHGGKHRRLWFSLDGQRLSYTVSDFAEPRAFKNATAQLRRLLSPNKRAYVNRTDEPPEEPQAAAEPQPESRVWQVKLAAYYVRGQPLTTVWFIFQQAVTERFPTVQIERLDEENWKLSPGDRVWSRHSNGWVKTSISLREVQPFAITVGEAIETDGEILIYLAQDKRNEPLQYSTRYISNVWQPPRPQTDTAIGRYLGSPQFWDTNIEPAEKPEEEDMLAQSHTEAVAAAGAAERLFAKGGKDELEAGIARIKTGATGRVVPTPELLDEILTPEPEKADPVITTTPMSPEDRMRALIREAREIEKLSPYRLIRDQNDRLVWRAPEIGDDE